MITTIRDNTIDVAKAFAMILVVLGHVLRRDGQCYFMNIGLFAYQFHVAAFFVFSGFYLRFNQNWITFLKKKVYRLWLPYVVTNIGYTMLAIIIELIGGREVIAMDMVKHCIKICLFLADSSLGRATWFLPILLYAMILSKLGNVIFDRLRLFGCRRSCVALLLSLVLAVSSLYLHLPYGQEKSLMALFFLTAGTVFKTSGAYEYLINKQLIFKLAILVVCVVICFFMSTINEVCWACGQYGNIAICIFSALSGTLMIVMLSSVTVKKSRLIMNLLSRLGQSTIWILAIHMFCFWVINFIQIKFLQKSPTESFLVAETTLFAWAYLLLGCILPTIVAFYYHKLRDRNYNQLRQKISPLP